MSRVGRGIVEAGLFWSTSLCSSWQIQPNDIRELKKEGEKVERKNIYDRKKVSWKKKASEQIVNGRHKLIRARRGIFSRESKSLRQPRPGDVNEDVY